MCPPYIVHLLKYSYLFNNCFNVCISHLCPTLCDPIDYSPPDFSVHGISQARILEWVAILFSRGSSQPRDRTEVSCIAGRFFIAWTTREAYALGISSEKTIIEKDSCTSVFIAALFTIARTWKQLRCPPIDEWIKKRWYIYTMEYCVCAKLLQLCLTLCHPYGL